MLKRIAVEGGVRMLPFVILLADLVQDGQIDGFGLLDLPIVGVN